MKEKHYKELGEKMGLEIEGTQQDEDHDSVFYSKESIHTVNKHCTIKRNRSCKILSSNR